MRLVDDEQEVLREVVEQRVRRAPRRPAVDVPAVVLDAGAGPDLAHHLEVVGRAHAQPLRLQQVTLPLELGQPVDQLQLDAGDGPLHPLRSRDVVRRREDVQRLVLGDHLAGQRVQRHQPVDRVAEHLDAHRELLVHREDLDGVAADPERAPGERQVVAGVLDVDEPAEHLVALERVADLQRHHPVDVLLRGAQAVDARHRGHHDDVPAGQQAVGRRVPQPLHLVVDRGVLLDVGVRLRDVRLGLVVVVVAHEVLDGVVREQLTELRGQLRSQGLVRGDDQGGALQPLDQPGGRGGLAGAGGTEQDDVGLAGQDAPLEIVDGLRLVTGRREVADDGERGDPPLEIGDRTHPPTVRSAADSRALPQNGSSPRRSDADGRARVVATERLLASPLGCRRSRSGRRHRTAPRLAARMPTVALGSSPQNGSSPRRSDADWSRSGRRHRTAPRLAARRGSMSRCTSGTSATSVPGTGGRGACALADVTGCATATRAGWCRPGWPSGSS